VRIVLLQALLIGSSCAGPDRAEDALGIWRVNPDRSTGPYSDVLTVRFETHGKEEIFTLDMMDWRGRATTSSSILYFDGKPRDFQDSVCSGTQSSWRVDSNTVEILRNCANGQLLRLVRRLSGKPKELVLEITEQKLDGRHNERRLVLKKQSEDKGNNPKTKF